MLEKILSSGNNKTIVGVSLTPGLGLEAVVYDRAQNTVLNYGKRKVEYNFSTREIQDYTQFKTALAELMDEMRILPKTMAYMVLPNVYFDFIELPKTMGDAEIKTAILSKAEEFYVFKREEPISGYSEVINPDGDSQKRIVYSSFQKAAASQIKDAFSDIGLQLVGIESSYSATLRGLYLTGLIKDVVEEQTPWTAMIVNTNSYTLLNMDGKNLIECSEVPLAIKSFSTEEAYQAIISSASQLLNNYASQKLYIISQTEEISAKVLKSAMEFDRTTIAINTNRFSEFNELFVEVATLLDYNDVKSITLGTIGAANFRNDFGLVLNALADDPEASMGIYCTTKILGTEVDITNEFIVRASVVLSCFFIILFTVLVGICNVFDSKFKAAVDDYRNRIQTLDEQIKIESQNETKQEVNMNLIIDDVAKLNVTANSFYDSIATDIPQGVWLTRYYNKAGDKIAVRGIAQSITDIYEYYKNLRIVSPESNIKLSELKVVTPNPEDKYLSELSINENTDRLYSFEISNIDIDFEKQNESIYKSPVNENDIIVKPNSNSNADKNVEQPSSQMTPTE